MTKILDILKKIEKPVIWLGASFFILTLFLFSFQYIDSNDFWWQLAIGKWIVENGTVMHYDVFSYTFNGMLFDNPHWMFDVSMYWIYSNFSYLGLNIFRFFIFLGSYFFLYKIITLKRYVHPLLILSLFFISIIEYRFLMRPGLSLYLFIFSFIYILYLAKYKKPKYLLLLPIIQAIWMNTNGGYIFGPVLVGIFFGSEFIRNYVRYRKNILKLFSVKLIRWYGIILVLTTLALFASSYGLGIIQWLSKHFVVNESAGEALSFIGEWKPSSITDWVTFGPRYTLLVAGLLWATIITLLLQYKRIFHKSGKKVIPFLKKINYESVLLLALPLYLALQHKRFVYLFILMAIMLLLRNIDYTKNIGKRLKVTSVLLVIISVGILAFSSPAHFSPEIGVKQDRYPEHVASFLLENNIQGPLFNEYNDGGYLIWRLYPTLQVFLDGRTPNLYTGDFFWHFQHASSDNVYKKLDNEYNFSAAIISNGSKLNSNFHSSEEWHLVFFDNRSAVFLKNNEKNAEIINENSYGLLRPHLDVNEYLEMCDTEEEINSLQDEINRNKEELSRPLYSLRAQTTLYLHCENTTEEQRMEAIEFSKTLVELDDTNFLHHLLLGFAYLEDGDDNNALIAYDKSLSIERRKENMVGKAIALYNLEKYKESEKEFSKAFSLPGTLPLEYYQIYGRVKYQLDKNKRAIELMTRYHTLKGEEDLIEQDYIDLAHAYKDSGDKKKYQEYLELSENIDN